MHHSITNHGGNVHHCYARNVTMSRNVKSLKNRFDEHLALSFNQNRVSFTAYTVKNNQANVHEANSISYFWIMILQCEIAAMLKATIQ